MERRLALVEKKVETLLVANMRLCDNFERLLMVTELSNKALFAYTKELQEKIKGLESRCKELETIVQAVNYDLGEVEATLVGEGIAE